MNNSANGTVPETGERSAPGSLIWKMSVDWADEAWSMFAHYVAGAARNLANFVAGMSQEVQIVSGVSLGLLLLITTVCLVRKTRCGYDVETGFFCFLKSSNAKQDEAEAKDATETEREAPYKVNDKEDPDLNQDEESNNDNNGYA